MRTPLEHAQILVVEDSSTQAAKLQYVLESTGYRACVCRNGEDALRLLDHLHPAAVITDVVMPGMSGFELCARVKSQTREAPIPVLLLTALHDPREVLRGLSCGADGFVSKPYSDQILLARLAKLLADHVSPPPGTGAKTLELDYRGETHTVAADARRTTDLLLAAYEDAVGKTLELEDAHRELENLYRQMRETSTSLELKVRRRTAQLQVAQADFRALLEASVNAIVVVDRQRVVRYANRRAHRLLSLESDGDLIGSAFDLPISLDETLEHTQTLATEGERIIESRAVPTTWDGAPAHVISLADITERRFAERAMRHAHEEEVRLRDRFLSHVSHEFRSPVTVIHQFVTILLDGLGGELSGNQQEYLRVVLKNVYELKSMIDDLMEVTRGDASEWKLRPATVDLAPVVMEARRQAGDFAVGRGIEIAASGPESVRPVVADPDRVRQIVLKLLTHAIRHTPRGSTVRVHWMDETDGFDGVRVVVEDRAPALGEYDRQHVFEKMHHIGDTADEGRKGLGLGLHIARELVRQQNGCIWVEPGEERGNRYCFTLPAAVADSIRKGNVQNLDTALKG